MIKMIDRKVISTMFALVVIFILTIGYSACTPVREPDEFSVSDAGGDIGVMIHYLNAAEADRLQKPIGFGINEIIPEGPAYKAGMGIGDIIVEVNGIKMKNGRSDILSDIAAGDSLSISYWPNLTDIDTVKTIEIIAADLSRFHWKDEEFTTLLDAGVFPNPTWAKNTSIKDVLLSDKWHSVAIATNTNQVAGQDGVLVMDELIERYYELTFRRDFKSIVVLVDEDRDMWKERLKYEFVNNYGLHTGANEFGIGYGIYLGDDNRLYVCLISPEEGNSDVSDFLVFESFGLSY
jgi:membrane-associated protease RseP (regulator of RpoE activity)